MENTVSHEVKLLDRNLLLISGVNKIIKFDNNEFLLDSSMGQINILGSNLELLNLDNINLNVKIKGKIKSISYNDRDNKKKEESLISKLFR